MKRQQRRPIILGIPTRAQLITSIRRIRALLDSRGRNPASVVGTALHIWSKRVCPQLAIRGVPWAKELMHAPAINILVAQLEQLPFLDAAYWLSTAYADLESPEYRKALAMYFTPPSIAKRLILDLQREGAKLSKHRFVDPACGGAAFLALVSSRMRQALLKQNMTPNQVLNHAQRHLAGSDLNKTLCAFTKHFLYMVFYEEICAAGRRPHFKILCLDSLRARGALRDFDVVVCNPPFRKLNGPEALRYRTRYSSVIQHQSNLYALFIQLATCLVNPEGLVGLVTPTSFISGQHFASLRTFLLEYANVRHIGLIKERERVYLGVEQETALTVLRTRDVRNNKITHTAVSVVERDGDYRPIGQCVLPNSGTSWPLARAEVDIELLQNASRSPFRLSDYGYSPSIGGFVWNRDKRPAYLTLSEVPRRNQINVVPLLWSSDIGHNGRLRFSTNSAQNGQHRYVDYGTRTHPSVKKRPCVVLQRVTSTDQARRLIGAVVPSAFLKEHGGFVGENHLVVLEQEKDSSGITPKQLLSLLQTPLVERYFRCISGSSNVSLFELEQIPLPDPSRLSKLLKCGVPMEHAVERLLLK